MVKFHPVLTGLLLDISHLLHCCNIASIRQLNHSPPTELTYPRIPLSAIDTFVISDNLNDAKKAILQTLEVDENSNNSIESATREQSNSDLRKNECKYRFTALRFQLVKKGKETITSFLLSSLTQSHSLPDMLSMD